MRFRKPFQLRQHLLISLSLDAGQPLEVYIFQMVGCFASHVLIKAHLCKRYILPIDLGYRMITASKEPRLMLALVTLKTSVNV